MNKQFHPPKAIGDKLGDFASGGLHSSLNEAICGKENRYGEYCTGECAEPYCAGFVAIGHLENQIGEAGIEYMKQLVKAWVDG